MSVTRAARRATYHLLKAAWEVMTAVTVVVEELNPLHRDGPRPPSLERVDVD